MKSRVLTLTTTVLVIAALAAPSRLAGQNQTTYFRHYKLIDMGTFGGSESSINVPVDVNGRAVNMQGVTVGFSATATPKLSTSNPIICGGDDGVGTTITHAFRWQNGTVMDLGALSPVETNCSNAYQVNSSGDIAGFSENGEVDPVTGTKQSRAVHWINAQIEELGSFGGNQNEALAINNRGQIVGFSLNTIPDPFSIFDTILNLILGTSGGTQTRAVLWQHGQMQDLGTLGGDDALAELINDLGQIAGASYTSKNPDPAICEQSVVCGVLGFSGVPRLDPFLWENGKMVDLGTLGGAWGLVSGLNDTSEVIGFSSVSANPGACFFTEFDPNCHPFLWKQGKLTDLNTSTIGGNPLTADEINDAGEIVGAADFAAVGGSPIDAYLWRNGVATDLRTVPGDCFSRAIAINASAQVVGNSFACDGSFHHAFLWENGSTIDLNNLIPAGSSLQLVGSSDINDRGEIAGAGVPPVVDPSNISAEGHAFLLIPVCADGSEGCAGAPLEPAVVQASATPLGQPTASSANSPNLSVAEIMSRPRIRSKLARRNLRLGLVPPN